ncbi:OmpA family protein [Limnobaculum parvum]|nr:OmpA family protein [Limnobaculum parvum]
MSQVNKRSTWCRKSAIGLISALLTFNAMANPAVDNDSMMFDSVESSAGPVASTPGPAVIMKHTGLQYLPVGKIGNSLSQVVFYNPKKSSSNTIGVADIYVDREFQGALREGQFSVFCLLPGKHIIEAYQNDAPHYTGKEAPKTIAQLNGGKTYFVETNSDKDNGTPVSVSRITAENQLFGYKSSATINRASAVKPCEYVGGMSQLGNVLFNFAGNKVSDIEAGGVDIVKNMAKHINSLPQIQRVDIVGHADPIGTPEFNQKLSVQRAETVKKMLISYGVPASMLFTSGEGANNPTVNCDSLQNQERNYCNRANRRVDALIQTNDSAE